MSEGSFAGLPEAHQPTGGSVHRDFMLSDPEPAQSPFREDDARLAAMHGYEPALTRIEHRLIRLERALKAGAIGAWGNEA